MNAEIISVGTELLLGDILNTNTQFLSKELAFLGIDVFYQSSVGDNVDRLKAVLAVAIKRSSIIILTGGLGPTEDDLTMKTVSDAVGLNLVLHAESKERMESYFKASGKTMPANNIKQAMLPQDSFVFPNDYGTAPGCAITAHDQTIIMLPGPPREIQPMFKKYVSKYLQAYSNSAIVSHTIHVYGIGESTVAEQLHDLMENANPTLAPYAKDGEVELRVTAKGDNIFSADAMCKPIIEDVKNRLGTKVYGVDIGSLENCVVTLLKEKGLKVATAESCTAGLVSKRITDISGSSAVFEAGIIAYSNDVKINLLGVPASIIDEFGAVSHQVARAMAEGVRKISGADIGIGITGIAGPHSDSTNKPIGLVYIAIADNEATYAVKNQSARKENERDYIRLISSSNALNFLRLYLLGKLDDANVVKPPVVANVEAPPAPPLPPVEKKRIELGAILAPYLGENENSGGNNGIPADNVILLPPDKEEGLFSKLFASKPLEEIVDNFKVRLIRDEAFDDNLSIQTTNAVLEEEILFKSPLSNNDEIVTVFNNKGKLEKNVNKADKNGANKPDTSNLPWYMKFAMNIFPWAGDVPFEVGRKLLVIAAFVALIISSSMVINYYYENYANGKINEIINNAYTPASVEKQKPDYVPYYSNVMNPKFAKLFKMNNELVGFITVDDTLVNDPVVQTTNNDKYLKTAFNMTHSRYGTVFADMTTKLTFENTSKNIVLYGHNMHDGNKFGQLTKFRGLDFYKKHPVFSFDTLYRDGEWKIFAVFSTNANPNEDNGQVFNYRRSTFADTADFLQWIEQCKNRSIITAPVGVLADDEMITLQTCAYDYKDERFIIMARRVRNGESNSVEVDNAKLNPKPLYPQAWYDKHGGVKPFYSVSKLYDNFEVGGIKETVPYTTVAGVTSPTMDPSFTMPTLPTLPAPSTLPTNTTGTGSTTTTIKGATTTTVATTTTKNGTPTTTKAATTTATTATTTTATVAPTTTTEPETTTPLD